MRPGLFSVWNYGSGAYDYYEGQSSGTTHAGTPPRARGGTKVGATPEQAAWPLPVGAKKIGSGVDPKGRIASLGGDSSSSGPMQWVSENAALVVAGIAVLWFTRKKKR